MKEQKEIVIPIGFKSKPEDVVSKIEIESAAMARDGWYFITSATDELLGNLYLFFERELDVKKSIKESEGLI